ncbi:MFS transporter [Micromonospora sp. NPDC049559]|uniref:MFS transporter n=1 Tax=Micromonospora sp. NPDC049559 TaxID=3155923 RepID=UPI00341B6DC6
MGGLPAVFWYLWTGLLINRVGAFAMLFMSLYLTQARGVSTALAGLVVGGYGVGGVAGTLLGGVLADRWGRRKTLVWSHLAAGVAMAVLGFTANLPVIAVLSVLLGVVHSVPGPAFVAAIVDVVPEQRRSRAFNLQFWAFNLGMASASLLAGLLAEASYLALFLVDAGTTLATAAVIGLKVPETLDPARRRAPATTRAPGLLTALTDRTFLVFVGLTFVVAVLTAQTPTILPLAMHADGLSPATYGAVVSLAGALIVVGQLFVPRLIDPYRKHAVLAISTGLTALGYGALAFVNTAAGYLLAATIWTIGSMLGAPPNAEINAELAPPALRARYQSVFFLSFPAAAFLAPTLGGVSLQYLGDAHWLVTAAVGLATAGAHLLAGPPRERRVRAGHPLHAATPTPGVNQPQPTPADPS